jgi:hypothetical protein
MDCPISDVPSNGICLFGRKDVTICNPHVKALNHDATWWVEAQL